MNTTKLMPSLISIGDYDKNSEIKMLKPVPIELPSVKPEKQYVVRQIRSLTDTTFVLRFDRNNMIFNAGQYITLGLPDDAQTREYSIYSSTDQPYLEILIREVDNGLISKRLHHIKEGTMLKVEGPFGFFTLDEKLIKKNSYLFIATGTGIAPFHSIAGSYPDLNFQILHGVRYASEAYERNFFPVEKYVLCTSRDQQGDFYGRVTDYLTIYDETDSDTLVYLCGNYEMIYQVYDILTTRGLNPNQIKTEVYF